MKTNFDQERAWWNSKANREEQDTTDEAINRLLRWREIERHLQNVKTILAVGAATGAFSIPLARRGFEVTHVDIAANMLEVARQKAVGISNIHFVEANAANLSHFADRSFDLVLNMDGAISFCGSEAITAIAESCRVTGQKLIITVSHRAWIFPLWVAASLEELNHFSQAVYAMLDPGEWFYEQFPENAQLSKNYLGSIKAFLPKEVCRSLENNGLKVLRCGGLGSLANLCGQEAVDRVLNDNALLDEFLNLCERFDQEILPDGPGTKQRAGLIAVAER
jgi:ubiquinone/menaquinone biosynthesis C-methylase UbiE